MATEKKMKSKTISKKRVGDLAAGERYYGPKGTEYLVRQVEVCKDDRGNEVTGGAHGDIRKLRVYREHTTGVRQGEVEAVHYMETDEVTLMS